MKQMNLGDGQVSEGTDIPGTLSLYLVRLPDGNYLGHYGPIENWMRAKYFTGMSGLLEAKEQAANNGGSVYIVSCIPPTPYQD